jgi:glycosyltransferase involved in cell wall biosynthesis
MHNTDSISIPKTVIPNKLRPIRILHVVGGMNRGGIETWLMHILRHLDSDRFKMDFLVHTDKPCAYDDEIRALGSRIILCPNPSQPWLYTDNFKRILRNYGPYDVVHSHVHHFSAYVLLLAKKAGVPVRIAHSHLDSSPLEAKAGWQRRLYLTGMKALIGNYATLGLGCSDVANVDLFGRNWKANSRWHLFYCGIDMTPFREYINTIDVRNELGIPANAFVIGHVGRFQEQKNHHFLLNIFAEVVKREPQAYLLLVGEGPLRQNIEQQALKIGVRDQIIFAGSRSDVPRLMMGAMDAFILPSLSEGLPVVSIETQAACLPCILSDVITEELKQVKPLFQQISLSQPDFVWADAVLAARNIKAKVTQKDCLSILEKSKFNIQHSVKELTKIYANECYKEQAKKTI